MLIFRDMKLLIVCLDDRNKLVLSMFSSKRYERLAYIEAKVILRHGEKKVISLACSSKCMAVQNLHLCNAIRRTKLPLENDK